MVALLRGDFVNSELSQIIRGLSSEEIDDIFKYYDRQLRIADLYNKYYRPDNVNYSIFRLTENEPVIRYFIGNTPHQDKMEWLWPKGRLLPRERPMDCALREFKEETGVTVDGRFMDDSFIVDSITGSNGRIYETHHWVYIFDKEPLLNTNIVSPEVAAVQWFTTEDALKVLRQNNQIVLNQALAKITSHVDVANHQG
jgi:8-oxo-dGTP pyrophosphatase MutT (NUDIX family)